MPQEFYDATESIPSILAHHSVFPLLDLPEEILVFHLCNFLDPPDIRALFLTSKQLYEQLNNPIVWHTLYVKSFSDIHGDGRYSSDVFVKWGPELYKMRRHSHMITFGDNGNGRLGLFASARTPDHYESLGFTSRMYNPLELTGLQGISDISAGGFSFQILDLQGNLYYTGRNWHGGYTLRQPGPSEPDEPVPLTFVNTPITKLVTGNNARLVSVSSGRGHFIALDAKGGLWSWDTFRQLRLGVPIILRYSSRPITGHILKIRAGWTLSSALVEGLGILVWKKRGAVTQWNQMSPAHPVYADTELVPNTEPEKITDYVVLDHTLIYLSDGSLYKVELNSPTKTTMELFKFNRMGRIVRINGCYNRFAAISTEGKVLLGSANSDRYEQPTAIRELQNHHIITVVAGDYHFLALDQDGNMYSWGRESQCNGCLGLGKLERIISSGEGRLTGADLIVSKPVKVMTSGRVLAVAAAGWQSAALVTYDHGTSQLG